MVPRCVEISPRRPDALLAQDNPWLSVVLECPLSWRHRQQVGALGANKQRAAQQRHNKSMYWTLVACLMAPSFTQAGVGVAYYSAPGPVSRAASYGASNGYTALRYELSAAQRGENAGPP
jgi:hypothetical protein